jgi:hypothetical protein
VNLAALGQAKTSESGITSIKEEVENESAFSPRKEDEPVVVEEVKEPESPV